MNPLLAKILGESGDVVPVIANVPQKTLRDRNRRMNARTAPDDSVKRMVGESSEKDEVIPKDAEPVDPSETTDGKPLRQPKEVVQEPSHPAADKEKYLTPYSALTAPDVTPQSTQPIDPSDVPGAATPEKFTAADLERAGEAPPAPHGDMAAQAMDVLLGKNRAGKPPTQPGEFEQAGQVTTEQAERMMGVSSITEDAQSKAANALVAAQDGGSGMPDPTPHTDSKQVCSVFRRFVG